MLHSVGSQKVRRNLITKQQGHINAQISMTLNPSCLLGFCSLSKLSAPPVQCLTDVQDGVHGCQALLKTAGLPSLQVSTGALPSTSENHLVVSMHWGGMRVGVAE